MRRDPEIASALAPVVDAFDRLGVRYYTAGSVVSSHFGVARSTADVDVVADLRDEHAAPLEALDRETLSPAAVGRLDDDDGARSFVLASAEDVVLHKLAWFKATGSASERQWGDVLGVLRVQASRLDVDYLRRWADATGVLDLLERALTEAAA